VLAGLGGDRDAAVGERLALDAPRRDLNRDGHAFVGDDQVAATGDQERLLAGLIALADRLDELRSLGDARSLTRGAAEPQGRELGRRDVVQHLHEVRSLPVRAWSVTGARAIRPASRAARRAARPGRARARGPARRRSPWAFPLAARRG